MSVLYHFTCEDAFEPILLDGFLRPGHDGLVWLTDLPHAPRTALGLTSYSLSCDRMAHRVLVRQSADTVWWMKFRRMCLPAAKDVITGLESAPGVMPMHWWVSWKPVPLL